MLPVADSDASPPSTRLLFVFYAVCLGLLPFWFPLPPYAYQLLDIRSFTPSLGEGLLYGGWLLLTFGVYMLLYRLVRNGRLSLPLSRQLLYALIVALPLLFTYPINANDLYRYFIRGRIGAVYGENQFLVPPSAFPDDPFRPLAGEWADESSPYGPVWELIATAVAAVSGERLLVGLLLFKSVGLLAHLATAVFIHAALKNQPDRRSGATWLWLANPALLLTFVVNGHNDALMLMLLMAAWWLISWRRAWPGLLAGCVAVLVKPIGILALPFLLLAVWQNAPGWAARLRWLLGTAVGGLILAGLAFWPFGSPLELAARLLRELSAGASFSPTALIVLISRWLEQPIRLATVVWIGQAVLALVAGGLMWRTFNGRSPLKSIIDLLATYLVTALNYRIWYSTWLFPWALVDTQTSIVRRRACLLFLLTSQLSVIIYTHLRLYLFQGNQTIAHLVGVVVTFGVPVLGAWGTAVFQRRR